MPVAAHADDNMPEHWQKAPERIVTVKAPYIDLRTFAGRGYPIFHVIEREDKVLIHKSRHDWFKVETLNGKVGWVARNDLSNTVNGDNVPLNFRNDGWQDHTEYPAEMGIYAGTIEGTIAYSAFVSYSFTPHIAADIKYTQAFGNFSNLKVASLGISHQPFPFWRLSPFFRIGSGVIQTNPNTVLVETEDREDPIISVGGGLIFHATSHLVLRVEYDNHRILTTRNVNEEVEEWKAGFGVLF